MLRHEPWLYELELDDEGWVPVDTLLIAIRVAEPRWTGGDRLALEQVIAGSLKRRHEMVGDRVRALRSFVAWAAPQGTWLSACGAVSRDFVSGG